MCVPKWFTYSAVKLWCALARWLSCCSVVPVFQPLQLVHALPDCYSCLTFQHCLCSDLLVSTLPALGFPSQSHPWETRLPSVPDEKPFPLCLFGSKSSWRVFRDYCCAVAHKSPTKLWWWLELLCCFRILSHSCQEMSMYIRTWSCLGFWDCQAAFPGPLDTKMAHSFQGKVLIDVEEQDRAADFRCTLICPVAMRYTTENPHVTHKTLFLMGYYWKRDSLKLFTGHLPINMNIAK